MPPNIQEKAHPPISTLPIPFIVSTPKSFTTAAATEEYMATDNLDALEDLTPRLPSIFYEIRTTEDGRALQPLSRMLIDCQNYLSLNPQAKSLPFPACDITTAPQQSQSLATPEANQANWHILSSCLEIHTEILGSPLTPGQSSTLLCRLFHFWLLLLACIPEVEEIAADLQRLETLAGGHALETYLDLDARYTDEEKAASYMRKYIEVSPYFLWLVRQGAGGLKGLNVGTEARVKILEAVEIRGAEALGGLEMAREVLSTVARTHVDFTVGFLAKEDEEE